jgi:hypothetical protein
LYFLISDKAENSDRLHRIYHSFLFCGPVRSEATKYTGACVIDIIHVATLSLLVMLCCYYMGRKLAISNDSSNSNTQAGNNEIIALPPTSTTLIYLLLPLYLNLHNLSGGLQSYFPHPRRHA